MDKLLNDFTVHRPIEEAWKVLMDIERIAPCLPGAQLQEIEGEIYRGVVKVKLGAISTAFKGAAKFIERDDDDHVAVLHGEGRDTTGKGNADAMITARLEAIDADTTRCVVETELHITGKVAQFGRGIMGDVSKKLISQFAQNLNTMLDASGSDQSAPDQSAPAGAPPAAAATVAGAAAASPKPSKPSKPSKPGPGAQAAASAAAPSSHEATVKVTDEASATPVTTVDGSESAAEHAAARAGEPKPTVRKIDGPANEPIELSNLAGHAVMKRLLPAVGGLVLLLLVLRKLRRR